ncbi:cupin domain-containing protein [Paenibacillus rhizovicinus]|uniref:Cupin domain-containing protein n=1 Tax=Paenibacillus rhizovicinus TaxID=2704463 RepID=A0A6C0P0R0_9BACL|nr:sugar phosphate nucleotidyltransferase [Paenibacillus rhizovicinus]QHW32047.1 cupin domain-containing protein [Paenibacillus rhizovicinus]
MRIVLLSGGSGKRLWPLSNEIRSKIYLKLLPSEDGGKESMIQRVCRQLEEAGLLPYSSIVAHHSQAEITQNHVGSRILFHAEPHRRGTFAAVALAASYLHARQLAAADETICVLPVDLFVESEFFRLLHAFPDVLAQSGADLGLLGTTPKHPSSQFGYIVPQPTDKGDHTSQAYAAVDQFIEKPNEEAARRLIDKQALWNCGVFAFPLSFMLSSLQSKGLPVDYEDLLDRYEQLPEVSFDVEIVEKTQRRAVIAYDQAWRDLGDWNALPDYLGSPVIGQGEISSDSVHTHVVNELACPIHVIGLSNVIVAASADGILVASKDKSNQIKQRLTDGQQPRFGEKRWGTYHVLDDAKTDAESETLTQKVTLLPGKNTSYHLHRKRTETWIILSGTGEFLLDAAHMQIQAGDVLRIPAGSKHAVKAITPLTFIAVQIGENLLGEEDVLRIAMTWEEIIRASKMG